MHEAMKVLEEDGQTLRVVLSGRLDSSTVDEIEPALRARLDDGTQHVLVDLREVSFAASMAIRMFIATARRLGAVVEGYDVRAAVKDQVESLGAKFVDIDIKAEGSGGYARELTAEEKAQQQAILARHVAAADVVVTTAAIPGRPSPKIITADMVAGMKGGSVIVDLAAEGGGNCELTEAGKTVVQHRVTIYGPLNVPSTVSGHASELYARNLLNLIATPLTEREMLSSFGIVGLLRTGVSVTVIGAVGVVFFAVSPTSAGVVLVPSAALLLLFGWSVALFVVGLTLQYGDRAEVFSWGTLVLLMPLSGVFYPVESLPPVLQAVARAIPLTHVFDAVRIGIEDGEVAWAQLAVAAVGTAVIAAASTWFVAHQLRRFRRDGWVTRFV